MHNASDSAGFYRWEVPDKHVNILLSLDLVDRLEREVIETFKAVTKRGSEIGGVLLGRVVNGDPPTVVIEQFQPVECEYANGPRYELSATDKVRLREALAHANHNGGPSVAGFFRSNTRRELVLDEEDQALAAEFFSDPRYVFLLVRPYAMKPSAGGFFVWEDGALPEVTPREFPFRRAELEENFSEYLVAGPAEPAAKEPPAVPKREERKADPPVALGRDNPVSAPPSPALRPAASLKSEETHTSPPASAPTPSVALKSVSAPPPPPAAPAPPPAAVERKAPPVIVKSAVRPAGNPIITPPPPPQGERQRAEPVVTPLPAAAARRDEPPAEPPATPAVERKTPPVVLKRPERPVVIPMAPRRERPAAASPAPNRAEPPKPVPAQQPTPVAKSAEPPKAQPAPKPPVAAKREEQPPVVAPTPAEIPQKRAAVAEAPAPISEQTRGPHLHGRLKWVATALVVVVVAAGAAFVRRGSSASPSATGPDESLGLRLANNSGQLLLSWNRNAPLITKATQATLTINDGDHTEDIELDLATLHAGSLVYTPISNDASFRLKVADPQTGMSQAESVRRLAGRPSAAVAGAALPDVRPAQPAPQSTQPMTMPVQQAATSAQAQQTAAPQTTPVPAPAPQAAKETTLAARLRVPEFATAPDLPDQSGALPGGAPTVPGASLAPPPPTPVVAQQPKPNPPAPAHAVATPAARIGGEAQKPRLVKAFPPTYTDAARRWRVNGNVRVVAVVGKDGRVKRATAVSGPEVLRAAAVASVMKWIYSPAVLNGEPIEGEAQVDVSFHTAR